MEQPNHAAEMSQLNQPGDYESVDKLSTQKCYIKIERLPETLLLNNMNQQAINEISRAVKTEILRLAFQFSSSASSCDNVNVGPSNSNYERNSIYSNAMVSKTLIKMRPKVLGHDHVSVNLSNLSNHVKAVYICY